jgi:branched-chain amino acid transport system substrate-binding protein
MTVTLKKLAMVLLLVGCMSSLASARDNRPVARVGCTASLTGAYAVLGREQLQGIQMWAEDLNARGALLGDRIEVVVYDDESNPEKSARLYRRLIEDDKVDLLIGPYGSDITYAASTVAEDHGMPMVAGGAAARSIWRRGYQNIFQIDAPADRYMDVPMRFAADQGLTRVAVVYADSEFPREVADGVREDVSALGMTLVFDRMYPEGQTEFDDLAVEMRIADPEVVLAGTYLEDSVGIVRAARKAGLSPAIFAMTVGPAQRAFGEALGPDTEGVMGLVAWMRSGQVPMAYDFSYRYKKRYGSNAAAQAAFGYAAGQVLEAAVRLAGSFDPDAVREQLRTMKFRSLLGHYRVDETGAQVAKKAYVMQWQDGYRLLVLPAEVGDAPVRFPFAPRSDR